MSERRLGLLAAALLSIIVGYFATNLIAGYYLPVEGKFRTIEWNAGGIGADQPSHRSYFRRVFDVPFKPKHAWFAVASDDYTVYVNGELVSLNHYVTNSGHAFQSRASGKRQGLTNNVAKISRAPELRRNPNQERSTPFFVDISRYVRQGRNVVAIALESANTEPEFSFSGKISNENQWIELNGKAEDWSSSSLPSRIAGDAWNRSLARIDGWARAKEVNWNTKKFARVDPQIWTAPPAKTAISGPQIGNEVRFRKTISDMSWRGATEGAWFRVRSSWHYSIFLDGRLVGQGPPTGKIEVLDVTAFLQSRESELTVMLVKSDWGSESVLAPIFSLDGFIDGRHFDESTGWQILNPPSLGWTAPETSWKPVTLTRFATEGRGVVLNRVVKPLHWNVGFLLIWIGCTTCLTLVWKLLSSICRVLPELTVPPANLAAAFLSIPSVALILIVILRLRYKESDTVLWFFMPHNPAFVLSVLAASLGIAFIVLTQRPARSLHTISAQFLTEDNRNLLTRIALLLILSLGFYLRMNNLGLEDLQADENVSFDAARGILRTGLPEAVSGVLYTRSPLYHYLLAGWIWVFGDTVEGARSFSVLAGVATIGVVYHVSRLFGASRALALIIALWIATEPWQITVSRNIRFYQQMQFFGLLGFALFLKGYVLERNRSARYWFFAAITAATLSQEVFVIFFPAFCIAGFVYYRPFKLREDWKLILGGIVVLTITIVDMLIFQILCLTPHVGIATTSGSILQLHTLNITASAQTFFSGTLRSNFLLTVAFFVCIIFKPKNVSSAVGVGYIFVFVTILVVTVLVVQIANRYLFALMPIFIITTIIGLRNAVLYWSERLLPGKENRGLRSRWSALVFLLLVGTGIGGSEIWRTFGSYNDLTIIQHETGYKYIRDNMQAGDVVVSVSPMSGAIILGGIDYYLMEQIYFDEIYVTTDTGIVDRWAGGKLVTNSDRLNDVFLAHERVWIMLNDFEISKMSEEMLIFIDTLTEPRFEFFGGELRLWTKSAGRYEHFQSENQNFTSF